MLPPRKQASLFRPDGNNSVKFPNLIMAIWYFSWFFCSSLGDGLQTAPRFDQGLSMQVAPNYRFVILSVN
jgi:hypothetical protein